MFDQDKLSDFCKMLDETDIQLSSEVGHELQKKKKKKKNVKKKLFQKNCKKKKKVLWAKIKTEFIHDGVGLLY